MRLTSGPAGSRGRSPDAIGGCFLPRGGYRAAATIAWEEPTMAQVRSWAGLDVHARSVLAVTVDAISGEMRTRRLPGTTSEVVEFCSGLPGPMRVAYEAGPTGYGLARALHAVGIGCVVAAPGKIERPSQDRVKTDQRDAERVLRLHDRRSARGPRAEHPGGG